MVDTLIEAGMLGVFGCVSDTGSYGVEVIVGHTLEEAVLGLESFSFIAFFPEARAGHFIFLIGLDSDAIVEHAHHFADMGELFPPLSNSSFDVGGFILLALAFVPLLDEGISSWFMEAEPTFNDFCITPSLSLLEVG